MSLAQLSFTMKLDHAYEQGAVAFVSAKNLLVPIRDRGDIVPTEDGEIMIRFAHRWLPVRPDQIKFCRRH
jgi:hypothetical protein